MQSGVTVFFVLSGALLSRPFWKNYFSGKAMPSLKVFFVRRAARIMPVFYLALTVSFLAEYLFMHNHIAPLKRFLTGLTFTSGFHYSTLIVAPANGPLWSISFEVISYVLLVFFMIGMFCLKSKRSVGTAIVYGIGGFAFVLFINELIQIFCRTDDVQRGWEYGVTGGAKYMMPGINPWGFFAQYLFGVAAAGCTVFLSQKESLYHFLQEKNIFDLIAWLGIGVFIVLMFVSSTWEEFAMTIQRQPYHFPMLTGAAALAVAFLPLSRHAGKIMDNRLFSFTAKLSFGIYIWHYLVLDVVFCMVKPSGTSNVWHWLPECLVVLLVTYLLAGVSWRYLEKPILNYAKEYTKRWM